jgi:hypothetical protein
MLWRKLHILGTAVALMLVYGCTSTKPDSRPTPAPEFVPMAAPATPAPGAGAQVDMAAQDARTGGLGSAK